MQYRMDISIDDAADKIITKGAMDFVALISPYFREVKPEERIKGANMGGQTGWTYAQKAFIVLTKERQLVHPKLVDYDAFARGIDVVTKLFAYKAILGGWTRKMEDAYMVIGIDLMEQAKYVRAALAPLAKSHTEYQELWDDLNFLYENRAEKAALTAEQNKRIEDLKKQVEELQKKG
jgi:hypothetical protein